MCYKMVQGWGIMEYTTIHCLFPLSLGEESSGTTGSDGVGGRGRVLSALGVRRGRAERRRRRPAWEKPGLGRRGYTTTAVAGTQQQPMLCDHHNIMILFLVPVRVRAVPVLLNPEVDQCRMRAAVTDCTCVPVPPAS